MHSYWVIATQGRPDRKAISAQSRPVCEGGCVHRLSAGYRGIFSAPFFRKVSSSDLRSRSERGVAKYDFQVLPDSLAYFILTELCYWYFSLMGNGFDCCISTQYPVHLSQFIFSICRLVP